MTVEQTGPSPALRARTLRAWIATTKRLLDNMIYRSAFSSENASAQQSDKESLTLLV
jgi:hypothetical protein